jgi:hypothetical protein
MHIFSRTSLILTCLTDIDLGGQLPTRQSTSGYRLYLNGQLFHWRGRTERIVIAATAAGEYIALSRGNQPGDGRMMRYSLPAAHPLHHRPLGASLKRPKLIDPSYPHPIH